MTTSTQYCLNGELSEGFLYHIYNEPARRVFTIKSKTTTRRRLKIAAAILFYYCGTTKWRLTSFVRPACTVALKSGTFRCGYFVFSRTLATRCLSAYYLNALTIHTMNMMPKMTPISDIMNIMRRRLRWWSSALASWSRPVSTLEVAASTWLSTESVGDKTTSGKVRYHIRN